MDTPFASHGAVSIRLIRSRDARPLQQALIDNRAWLSPWEATNPDGAVPMEMRGGIRRLLQQYREGSGVPLVMEYNGEIAGQLNVWGISRGSMSSGTIGYWIDKRFAGKGITPVSVALATDMCFQSMRLHRMEICIRPENAPSLRVVEKLGFRYEGYRERFIHIDGDWRDHHAFALTREDVPQGVLQRWIRGQIPAGMGSVPGSIPVGPTGTEPA